MAKPKLTSQTLRKIMRYQLAAFNDEGETLSDDTVHDTVLSADDGVGAANSKNIYRASIRWVLAQNGFPNAKWPQDWMSWTVTDLAAELLK